MKNQSSISTQPTLLYIDRRRKLHAHVCRSCVPIRAHGLVSLQIALEHHPRSFALLYEPPSTHGGSHRHVSLCSYVTHHHEIAMTSKPHHNLFCHPAMHVNLDH
ncbi:hypothetical protein CIPAW_04G128300 [Carya illinoinensis]|uniref:Uncharacterized protein n=1 Tax=Carya illinoinensis TaxID=32201 RepID=A0A8T1QVK8_CARIL|nr:hypothetical protein CIPAW_04G128300 [Carya illinoinensis]